MCLYLGGLLLLIFLFFHLYTLQYTILAWKMCILILKASYTYTCMFANSLPYWQWDIHFAFPKPWSQT